MNQIPKSIFPPNSLDEVIAQIAFFPAEIFDVLVREVRGSRGFDAPKDRCERLAGLLGIPAEGTALLLSALSYLYTRVAPAPKEDAREMLVRFAEGFDDPDLASNERESLADRLHKLLAPSEQIDRARKINRLRSGFLRNAVGFGSFVDVRPDFVSDNSHIRGFAIMTQIRITTDSENQNEKDFVFQIDEAGLAALREAVLSAEKKILTLKSANMFGAQLYVRELSDDQ